jgi:L-ascorbate metabolism protein UlaG (beta-lactamase superfamily)
MRLTLIGHACWLIETTDLTILTDPVFGDVFQDNLSTPCPARRFNPEALPDIDIVYLSHRHHDHFDPPTLAGLARRVPALICPVDEQSIELARRVGFEKVQPVKEYQAITVGKTQLHFTPSTLRRPPEHGLLVTDPDARIWNQVDTVLRPEWLPLLRIDGRTCDVQLANFNPILNEMNSNGVTRYPYAAYGELLETVRAVRAKLVIPGAVGFSWINRGAWLNHTLFPIKHERFVEDVRSLELGARAEVMLPGDVIEIRNGDVSVHRQARTELVSTPDPSTLKRIDFNPTRYPPTLLEMERETRITVGIENRGELVTRHVTVPAVGYATPQELDQAVGEIIAKINENLASPGFELSKDVLKRWNARMQVLIHFPDGPRYWSCDFAARNLVFRPGQMERANYFFETTATDLHGIERGLIWGQFEITGYRCFHTLYRLRDEGIAFPRLPSQFHRAIEEESGQGDVPNPFDTFMVLWGPTTDAYIRRLTDLSLAPA